MVYGLSPHHRDEWTRDVKAKRTVLGLPPGSVQDLVDVYGYVINGMDPDPMKHPEDSDLFSNPVECTEHIDPKTGLIKQSGFGCALTGSAKVISTDACVAFFARHPVFSESHNPGMPADSRSL